MTTRRDFLRSGVAALGAMSGLPMALGGDETAAGVAPFPEALLISGRPRERGRAYGEQCQSEIRRFLDAEIYGVFEKKVFDRDDLLRYADACFKVIQDECPIIADEMEGMAEGSGLTVEEHVLITLHEELYHRGVLPPVPHCTAIAVGPPETRGETYVAQTWDWMPTVAGMSRVLEWRRDEGPSLLAYAFPGLWVGAGMNSSGIAFTWTAAKLGEKQQMPRIGLPAYVLLTHLLYQPSLDAVADAAARNRHAGWFTFVFGDGTGRLLNVEGSPEEVACEETTGRLVRVGYGSRQMLASTDPQGTSRHPRCVTVDALLDQTRGATDLAAMQQNLGDPARGICVGKATIDMMIYNTTDRTAYLSRGAEYGIEWREFRFS